MNMINYPIIDLEEAMKKRGEKTFGFLRVAQKVDCTWVQIPVWVVCGEQEGPVFVADSNTHGDEYEGAEAIGKFAMTLDPAAFRGTFIGVPGLNQEAMGYGKRENHMDYNYTNMNRAFPGNPESYITNKLAAFYFEHVVSKANYMVNFHGGGNVLYVTPQIGHQPKSNECGMTSYKMAKAFGFECLYGGENMAFGGTMRVESFRAGVPSITVEIGSQSTRHADRFNHVERCVKGLHNIMAFAGMVDDEVEYLDHYIETPQSLTYLYAPAGGFHIPVRQEKEYVHKGEVLGVIRDVFGNEIAQVCAPFDGIVYGYCDYPVVQPGNWSYLFAKVDN